MNTTTAPAAEAFVLTPPEALVLPTQEQAKATVVALAPAERLAVDSKLAERVGDFVKRIEKADLQSPEFNEMLQKAFAAGRKEAADTTNLIHNNPILNSAKLGDLKSSGGDVALQEISSLLSKANPKGRDLMGPVTIFGVPVPYSNKLRSYLDEFKVVGARIDEQVQVLQVDEDDTQREILEYDSVEKQLYNYATRLDRATEYLALMDRQVSDLVETLGTKDVAKAKVLKEEVLFYVRSNLNDVAEVKLLAIVGMGQIRQLRHTGRMTLRATNRIKTTGMAALAIAQMVSIAAFKQKKRMDTNLKVQNAVNDIVASVGETILDHTKRTIEFETNPVFSLQALESSIDKTMEAVELYNNFRSEAVETMAADNLKLVALTNKAKTGFRFDESKGGKIAFQDQDVMSL